LLIESYEDRDSRLSEFFTTKGGEVDKFAATVAHSGQRRIIAMIPARAGDRMAFLIARRSCSVF
jgi:hypothetical protein